MQSLGVTCAVIEDIPHKVGERFLSYYKEEGPRVVDPKGLLSFRAPP
jgi:hypothetical protein